MKRPNILIFYTDQQRGDTLGNDEIITQTDSAFLCIVVSIHLMHRGSSAKVPRYV